MKDWNVVVTYHTGGFRPSRKLLEPFGQLQRTEFPSVLVMRADDVEGLLSALEARRAADPTVDHHLSRLIPVTSAFRFESPEDFQEQARAAVQPLLPRLAGKSFHVRIQRRGFKGRLTSAAEERWLGGVVLDALESAGTPARVSFQDPDCILAVEMLGTRAGLSLWTREQLRRYPFLRLS